MRGKGIVLNSFYNSISLALTTLISFIIRKILISYIGIEILGVNTVVVETLGTLSLCEMGLQTAIVYRLYKPLAEKDYDKVAALFQFLKKAYFIIGLTVLILGIVLTPFVPSIVNSTVELKTIYLVYYFRLGAVALSFFLSYYRVLFVIHEKQYRCVKVDIVAQLIVCVLQIFVLSYYQNYILYILCEYVRLCIVYTVIIYNTKKEYSYIKEKHIISKEDKKNIFADLKEIIFGNLAGFIYSSTDNMVISIFCGSLIVGFLSNYKTITSAVRGFVGTANSATAPTWGNYLHEKKDNSNRYSLFLTHTLCQFIVCLITLIPTICLADDFIAIWLGKDFIISKSFILLIVADIFIQNLHEPAPIVMRGEGMFKEDKTISIIATIVNIITSICLVISWGPQGVLLGTVMASMCFWILRVYAVVCGKWKENFIEYIKYFVRMFVYIVIFIVEYCVCELIIKYINLESAVIQFIVRGLVCEVIIGAVTLVLFWNSKSFRFALNNIVIPLVKKRGKQNADKM